MKFAWNKSAWLALVAVWSFSGYLHAAQPVFASGIVGNEFSFAYNREGAELMGKIGPRPNLVVLMDGKVVTGVLEIIGSGEVTARAGKVKPMRITMSREYTGSSDWKDWFKAVRSGKLERKSVSVIVVNEDGTKQSTINLHECWPVRWKAPELNSNSDTYIVEELEFAVERVERG